MKRERERETQMALQAYTHIPDHKVSTFTPLSLLESCLT